MIDLDAAHEAASRSLREAYEKGRYEAKNTDLYYDKLLDGIIPASEIKAYVTNNPLEGTKFDSDKLPMHLLPPELMTEGAKVLQYGANKYSERNWEQGMDWSRVYSALFRHMLAWWGGEDKDPETGFSHLSHAACCIAFLVAYEARSVGTDDRPIKDFK